MAYKTCPDCGSRIFEYGCVNCNEQDYITMQGCYDEPEPEEKKYNPPPFTEGHNPFGKGGVYTPGDPGL